jgi:hypothetical protein
MTFVHITAAPGHTVDDFRKVIAKTNSLQDIDGLITWAAGSDASGPHVVARVGVVRRTRTGTGPSSCSRRSQEFGLGPDMMEMTTYDAYEFYLRS